MSADWGRVYGWGVDFIRAMRERTQWTRILFRVCMGRYAYREFIGLMDALGREGFSPYFTYGLEGARYHQDRLPHIDW